MGKENLPNLAEDPASYPAQLRPDEAWQAPKKFYFDGGQVEVVAELVHELDADGKQLRVVKLTDYTAEKVRTLCTGPEDLRARWADAGQREEIIRLEWEFSESFSLIGMRDERGRISFDAKLRKRF